MIKINFNMHEYVFCRRLELIIVSFKQERHKQICVIKKANGLNFDNDHDEVKEGHSIKFESKWSKESKRMH